MKILLTGSTGYIGRRLLPVLVKAGHKVVCPVRDKRRFDFDDFSADFLSHVEVLEVDFTAVHSIEKLPKDIDAAYYFLHSLTSGSHEFQQTERLTAEHFAQYIRSSTARQVIYLGGISNDSNLSEHLTSRLGVETILQMARVPVTVLRSAIIIGSGGSSFEIIRDLVEKLPIMIAPKWLQSRCQPIAIANVLEYLLGVLDNEKALGRTFDIGGADVLTYKHMLLQFAEVRGLHRTIITVPVLTIRLSSLWLYLVTSTSYQLARNLVDSMRNEVVCKDDAIDEVVKIQRLTYKQALERTFLKISQGQVVSSWKDAIANPEFNHTLLAQVDVPRHGCFVDRRTFTFTRDSDDVFRNVWEIGGERGWYYGNWMWSIRGFLDKLAGGVGLRRGRRSASDLKNGDSLDFWRVLYANKEERRLLLFAEMKLPGDAWLEFKIQPSDDHFVLIQTATFRPLGLWGRVYWYIVLPFHGLIFNGMGRNMIAFRKKKVPSKD
jgi:uncharacterized protein YbjT (DUF2867 family)